jgi:hypothetical protein
MTRNTGDARLRSNETMIPVKAPLTLTLRFLNPYTIKMNGKRVDRNERSGVIVESEIINFGMLCDFED